MRIARMCAALGIATVAAACGRRADATRTSQARDSAGVRIVQSERPRWRPAEAWSVAADPEISIGRREGEAPYLLNRVRSVLSLPGGRIAVANSGSSEIRFYDSAGVFLGASGRKGEGPGEFQALQWPWKAPGDSLAAFDGASQRVTLLDSAGGFGRTVTLSMAGDHGIPSAFGSAPSGDLLVTSGVGGYGPGATGHIDGGTIYLTRYSAEGAFVNEIVAYPGSPHWAYQGSAYYYPFAVGWMVFGWGGDRLYSGTGGEPEVRISAPDGTPREILRWSIPERPVTDDLKAQYRETLLADAQPARKPFWERWLADVPFPDRLPTYQTLLADADGDLWVERYRTDWETEPIWWVFGPDGAWLGRVSTPERFEITEIGDGYLLGVHRDEMDVEQVRMYPLLKPS